jgi:hypothetical protein
MLLWIFGILFFAITFGPRFFTLMNFGYGFLDLGLYSQFFYDLTQGFFNPYIPSLYKMFFALRPEPLLLVLWPLSYNTTHPAVFLFLDEAAVITAAAVCANFTWRKTQSSAISIAIFISILFSPLLMDSLHSSSTIELWAQPFLALLFTEYFSRRRPLQMGMWFALLCLLNLNFCVLGILLLPLSLFTQRTRWKFKRRTEVALVVTVISLLSMGLLHFFQSEVAFETEYLWGISGPGITKLLLCFWIVPVLVPEIVFFSLLLLVTQINGQHGNPVLLVSLVALGPIVFFDKIKIPKDFRIYQVLSCAIIASSVYYNLISPDPFFGFWKLDRWAISDENKKVHEIMTHIPPLDTLAASSCFTPLLGNRLSLMTLSSVNWRQSELPRYILTRNEAVTDLRFSKIEENVKTGTRLLVRFK